MSPLTPLCPTPDGPQPEGPNLEDPKPQLLHETQQDKPGRAYDGGDARRPATPFFSPPPNVQPPGDSAGSPPLEGKKNTPRQFVALGLIVAALAGGAWFALSSGGALPPNIPTVSAPSQPKQWHVTAADFDQKATDQLKALLSGGTAETDALNAQNAPALSQLAEKSPEMAAEIESGQRRLYRIHLLDFMAQDGDFVELFVDGVSFGDINLSNAGSSILLPVMSGKPIDMKMVAKVDGGGGVTVAFVSDAGEARTSVLEVGQFEQWQVVLK
jgi:hypothetical protein